MFGLEKDPAGKFEFDLEKDLHKHPDKAKKILEKAHKEIASIKKQMKEGSSKKEADELAILLQGYNAIERVIKRIGK